MKKIKFKKNINSILDLYISQYNRKKNKCIGKFNNKLKIFINDKKLLNIYKKLGFSYSKSYIHKNYYFLKNIIR